MDNKRPTRKTKATRQAKYWFPGNIRSTPLRKVSKKRAIQNREYLKLRTKLLSNGAGCEYPDCIRRATQIHHLRGRYGEKLVDTRYLMLICAEHHQWIHDHPNRARQRGLLQ